MIYCYRIEPIDWCELKRRICRGMLSLQQAIEQARDLTNISQAIAESIDDDDPSLPEDPEELFESAKRGFAFLGWEGDVMEGPMFFGLPSLEDGCSLLGCAVKQDNNGATFVASPFELPHLEDSGGHNVVAIDP